MVSLATVTPRSLMSLLFFRSDVVTKPTDMKDLCFIATRRCGSEGCWLGEKIRTFGLLSATDELMKASWLSAVTCESEYMYTCSIMMARSTQCSLQ